MADLLLLGLTRSKTKEWVTAHKISLLILVKCYVDTNNDNKHSVDIKAQREFSYSMLKWIQSPDIELKELLPQVEAISEEFFQALQNKLGEIQVSGLSSLVEFFQTLDKLLESNDGEANVHKSSII
ncbi:anaphase-promoting complex subunit 5-like, partial [Saccoglossus kowalevskii]